MRPPDALLVGIVVMALGTTAAQTLAADGAQPLTLAAVTPDSGTYRYHALPQRYLTIAKKPVSIGFVVEWRVGNAERFGAAAGGNPGVVSGKLADIVEDYLRERVGGMREDSVRESRPALATDAMASSRETAARLGVVVIDVKLKLSETTPPTTN